MTGEGTGPDGTGGSGLLRSQEATDDGETGGYFDEGYSPAERPLGVREWGITAREAASHEDLGHRLRREVKEKEDDRYRGDGLGDTSDTDGELIDDLVGDLRAGRLVAPDGDETALSRTDVDYWATDVGIDGGAASAEEAAIHIIPASGEYDF
jgi:hypothetical protein